MFLVVVGGKNKSSTREIRTRDDDPQDSPLTIYKHSRAQLCVCVCVFKAFLNFILFSLSQFPPSLSFWICFGLWRHRKTRMKKKKETPAGEWFKIPAVTAYTQLPLYMHTAAVTTSKTFFFPLVQNTRHFGFLSFFIYFIWLCVSSCVH
jgi:hypothetical protein